MTMIKVCINYEFGIELDVDSEDELNREFAKLRDIVSDDTEKFILSNTDNSTMKKKVLFELAE